jgi:threonine/homoserine/homoserine lactone efflux protein
VGAAIGDILGLAAGVAVSPLPIVAMILVLATPRGRANGLLFGVGWLAGLAILGALLSAVNPKNAALTIAAAATIAGAGLSGGEQAVVLAVFVLIGSVGVLAPLVVYLFAGAGAARTLDSWKTWAATNNAAVLAVLFLVFGFKLVGDGIAVLF